LDILSLTTSEAIRAALGISGDSDELIDQALTDLGIEDMLKLEFYGWLPQSIASIEDAADAETDETQPASLAYLALRAAATYYCASIVAQPAEIAFAVKHSDGQNEFQRKPVDVDKLIARLRGSYADYREQVLSYLSAAPVTVPAPSWMTGSASPSYDPVTNQ
jgi:hypothetical protein